MTLDDLRRNFESEVYTSFTDHKGTRRVAAEEVARTFGINPRTVFRIVARKKKSPVPR